MSSIIDDELYTNVRRELGKDKEDQLIEAVTSARSDARKVLGLIILGVVLIFLMISLISFIGVFMMNTALALVVIVLALGWVWFSIRAPEARSRGIGAGIGGTKTGVMTAGHEDWLVARAKYGFWKGLVRQILRAIVIGVIVFVILVIVL